jgi:UDP-N-acetylglucosamine 1-carboxyvinyltransferase
VDSFRIDGPQRLAGTVRAGGAKNAALPAMTAALLGDEPLRIAGVPRVRDVETMRKLLLHLGVESRWQEGELWLGPGPAAEPDLAPYELVKTMRASVLVLGPLTARRGHARVSLPGGCAIGVRPIDQHLAALAALGAEVRLEHGYVETRARRLVGTRFRFALPTVTGTENVMMAAALAEGVTELDNCACEPEVADLAALLNAMGARIAGAGTASIRIEGVDRLGGTAHAVIPDRIEGGTYLVGAAITGGDVTLTGTRPADLEALLAALERSGASVTRGDCSVRVVSAGPLRAHDVTTAPYPGFATDLQAQYVALMTQASGTATVSETVFENRMQHVAELARMGADIRLEGSTARVHGPTPLSGAHVMATDLRASACLVLAALAANGESIVDRIYHLDRGYESMETKLAALGARVERIRGSL